MAIPVQPTNSTVEIPLTLKTALATPSTTKPMGAKVRLRERMMIPLKRYISQSMC